VQRDQYADARVNRDLSRGHSAQAAPELRHCEQRNADERHAPPHQWQCGKRNESAEDGCEAPQHDAEMQLQPRARSRGAGRRINQ
jgi:hypothetical protein